MSEKLGSHQVPVQLPSLQPSAAWLAASVEEALEPQLPIIDCHHHFSEHWGGYLLPDLLKDTASGHDVRATVYVQCGWNYHASGPGRCMFESNYPVDRAAAGYGVIWNAYKRLVAGAGKEDKARLFHDTAARVYRL